MKRLKWVRLSALVLCLVLFFTGNVFASTYSMEDDIDDLKTKYAQQMTGEAIEQLLAEYAEDPEFQAYYELDRAACIDILEGAILHKLTPKIMPLSVSGPIYYVNMTPVKQKNNYYCGPATIVQSLIGMGKYSANLSAATYNSYQTTPAAKIYTTTNGTAPAPMVTELNRYTGGVCNYTYNRRPVNYRDEQIEQDLSMSLQYNRPPIIKTVCSKLPYYKGNAAAEDWVHYISVKSICTQTKQITLTDPHYDSWYFGNHSISYDEFRDAMLGQTDSGQPLGMEMIYY